VALIALIWFGSAVLCSMAAKSRGRDPVGWFILGLIFGVFALAAVLLMQSNRIEASRSYTGESDSDTKTCPDCAETIKAQARVCRFCTRKFSDSEIEEAMETSGGGTFRSGPKKQCRHCRSLNHVGNKVCGSCGGPL
jgi:RNA polymerase subunit RPABC4/transcription elongation factor Spt4